MPDELHPIILGRPGESAQSLAGQLSRYSELSFDDSLRTLCQNNQITPHLPHCGGQALWIRPEPLSKHACLAWEEDRQQIGRAFLSAPNAARVAQENPRLLSQLHSFVDRAEDSKWGMGEALVRAASLGATGASAYGEVLQSELGVVAQLADEVYTDVMSRFRASRSPFGVSRAERGALEQMLRSHPSYAQLRRALDDLPRFVRRRLGSLQLPRSPLPNADFFRRQFVVPNGVRPGRTSGELRAGSEIKCCVREELQRVPPGSCPPFSGSTPRPPRQQGRRGEPSRERQSGSSSAQLGPPWGDLWSRVELEPLSRPES